MKLQAQKAHIGDEIIFMRKEMVLIGTVVKLRETTVLVELDDNIVRSFGLDFHTTVVAHKNYQIKNTNEQSA